MRVPVVIGALLILLSSCSENADTVSEETMVALAEMERGVIVMEPGKEYQRTGFRLRVDSVMNESRCPEELICIWGGNVEVRFDLQQRGRRHNFILNTSSTYRRDTVIYGVRYALIDVSPYPRLEHEIPYEDYRVTVSVGK